MKKETFNVRWMLVLYDILVFAITDIMLFVLYDRFDTKGIISHTILAFIVIFLCRFVGNIYRQIWRYGGIQCYIRLLFTDAIAFLFYYIVSRMLPIYELTFVRMLALVSMNLLGSLAIRMIYRYAYKCGNRETNKGRFLNMLLRFFLD